MTPVPIIATRLICRVIGKYPRLELIGSGG
jgi:hypothetical protein